jgi:hypothetical protein
MRTHSARSGRCWRCAGCPAPCPAGACSGHSMASCPWDPGRAAMSGHLELTHPEAIRSNIGIVNFDESRSCFRSAAHSFVELVDEVRPEQWMLPALGVWDVRSLVGHTARARSTIEAYLATPSQGPGPDSPVAYFLSVLSSDHESEERKRQDAAIAERGRQAGAELGADPAKTVRELTMRYLHEWTRRQTRRS